MIGHRNLRNDIAFPGCLNSWVFQNKGLDPTIVFISGGVRMIQAIVSDSAPDWFRRSCPVTSAVAGEPIPL